MLPRRNERVALDVCDVKGESTNTAEKAVFVVLLVPVLAIFSGVFGG